MKILNVTATSLKEAKAKAREAGIIVLNNVTNSYEKAGKPSGNQLKTFMEDQLTKKHIDDVKGMGLVVVAAKGSADTRIRPYEMTDIISEGRRKVSRVVEVKTKSGKLVCEASTKKDAVNLAKKAMVDFKEDMVAEVVYKVQEGKDKIFELKYTPSINTVEGLYIVFGVDNDTEETI